MTGSLRDARVLLVGAGGLGCAAGRILARSGIGGIDVLDDDHIELSNLHRQFLYHEREVGRNKAAAASEQLIVEAARVGHSLKSVAREIRVVPDSAAATVAGYDLVLEGADNFATKFLVADACAIARVALVQAGVVRWGGWALGSVPAAGPCLRCVFEDVPRDQAGCAVAGVVGPVVGVLGSLQAAIALRILTGARAAGELWSFDGLVGALRVRAIERQPGCALCAGFINDTNISRYIPPGQAA